MFQRHKCPHVPTPLSILVLNVLAGSRRECREKAMSEACGVRQSAMQMCMPLFLCSNPVSEADGEEGGEGNILHPIIHPQKTIKDKTQSKFGIFCRK